MSLGPGARLGPYEIQAALGAGGMGEVYRATDTNLGRAVAIKVLPDAFAQDPERVARFEREARTLASLNHPNIAIIHGLEKSQGTYALVMELVEGEDLSQRIARGPIPLDEALPIARQIAEALETAHELGIIHRDLKPANIKVTLNGGVKVLDFGLAKAMEPASSVRQPGGHASMSPTITSPAMMTGVGVLLGTAAYMSPEQARGRPVDQRGDVWAFGCVLFEMLTGARAFEDEDVSMTLSKVLQREPDLAVLPRDVPARVRQSLRMCLQKDPTRRIADIRDVQLALEGAFETGSHTAETAAAPRQAAWRRALPVAVAASLVTAVVVVVAVRSLTPPQERAVVRFEYALPTEQQFRNPSRPVIALSPDGRRLVHNTTQGLYLRALDEVDAHVILGTEGTLSSPFFSPDGQSVGYFQNGQLKRIAARGGAPVVICPADNPFGVSWEADDSILFGQATGIVRVPAAGGMPELVIPAKDGEQVYGPQLLPDSNSVLFSVTTLVGASRWDGAQIVVQSLRSNQRQVVLQGGSDARYIPTGHLVYALKDGLFAVPFDADRRRVTGTPVSMAESVMRDPNVNTASANYGVSRNGTLIHVASMGGAGQGTLTWVTRDGRETAISTNAVDQPRNPRFSPDGKRLALIVAEDLWVYDMAGRPPIKLNSETSWSPVWTPDGQRLVYESPVPVLPIATGSAPGPTVLVLPADGSTTTPQAISPAGHFHPYGWSADGGQIVAVRLGTKGTGNDIVRWSLAKTDTVQPLVETPANEGAEGAMVSHDGRWLAYASDQTGRQEIWVRPLAGPGAAVRVSPNGGVEPVWARSGRELYYLEGTQLMAVEVPSGESFAFSAPTRLFAFGYVRSPQPPSYDVAADGRFLVLKPVGGKTEAAPPQIVVVLNWHEELKRLVPTR